MAKIRFSLPPLDEELAKIISTDLGLCPRCGRPIDWVEYNQVRGRDGVVRTYVYAVHETIIEVGGKKRRQRKKCYLGPVEDYVHATTTHTFSIESGVNTVQREVSYLMHLVDFFDKYAKALEKVLEWLSGVEEARDIVQNLKEVARKRAKTMMESAERIEEIARKIIEIVNRCS